MDSFERAWIRARLPFCIVAACGFHAVAATALPLARQKATRAVLADAPANPLDIDNEAAPGPASEDPEEHPSAQVATPMPAPAARERMVAPAPKETSANPP